jgi:hypothetical protein
MLINQMMQDPRCNTPRAAQSADDRAVRERLTREGDCSGAGGRSTSAR